MILQKATLNSTHTPQALTFINNNGLKIDLTGGALSGYIYNREGQGRAVAGTLTPDAETGPQGGFDWVYDLTDVSVAGQFMVQFLSTFSGSPDTVEYSESATWIVEDTVPGKGFNFSYDITTPIGQVRLHIGDTNLNAGPFPGRFNFLDNEIQHFLNLSKNNLTGAIVIGLMTLSTSWTNFATAEWVGQPAIKIDTKQVAREYQERADWFRKHPVESLQGGTYGILPLPRRDAWTRANNPGVTSEYG